MIFLSTSHFFPFSDEVLSPPSSHHTNLVCGDLGGRHSSLWRRWVGGGSSPTERLLRLLLRQRSHHQHHLWCQLLTLSLPPSPTLPPPHSSCGVCSEKIYCHPTTKKASQRQLILLLSFPFSPSYMCVYLAPGGPSFPHLSHPTNVDLKGKKGQGKKRKKKEKKKALSRSSPLLPSSPVHLPSLSLRLLPPTQFFLSLTSSSSSSSPFAFGRRRER